MPFPKFPVLSIFSLTVLFFALLPTSARALVHTVGPSNNWCATINSAVAGDEVVLNAGTYTSSCTINARGSSGAPITVRSLDSSAANRAVMAYAGSSTNVFDLQRAAFVTIRWITFQNSQPDVDAIKIRNGNDFIIEQNTFQSIGGQAVSANSYDTKNITFRNNTVKNQKATALYFGCQDGVSCHSTNVVVQGNLIQDVTSTQVGYGLEIKMNSYGTVRDNTIYRTKGPGVMVYGSDRGDPASILEGNYIEGSTTDSGIVVGGGPAIIRNNVLVGNSSAGIYVQDYNSRNLQSNVWVVNNTALNNSRYGINIQGWYSNRGNVLAFNAIAPASGTSAINPASPTGTVSGNVTCSPATSCFDQPTAAPFDLWGKVGGPLIGKAGSGSESWRVKDDFMGVTRGTAADVGAFQRTSSGTGTLVGGGNPRPPRITSSTPPPPSGLNASAGDAKITLAWSASSGASSYAIYRAVGTGSLSKFATSTSTSYVDSSVMNGTTYKYAVTASNTSGESGYSSIVSATPQGTVSAGDFGITASPTSLSTTQAGAAATSTLTVVPLNGFNSAVTLSVSAPSGISVSLSQTTLTTGSGSSVMTVTAGSSTPVGASTITVTATGSGIIHTTSVVLNVSSGSTLTWEAGFDFRGTAGFVTDPSGSTYVISGSSYPTSRGGFQFGWTQPTLVTMRDRNKSVSPRLAGVHTVSNLGARAAFYIDLPAPGTYDISLAMGDMNYLQCPSGCKVQFLDGAKLLFSVAPFGTPAGSFYDANGRLWSASSWPTSNGNRRVNVTGNRLVILVGAASGKSDNTPINFVGVKKVQP